MPCSSASWRRAIRSGRRSIATAQTFRVYFLSDRGGIYALGYPVISWIGHLINLAELVMLAVRALRRAARRRRRSSARSSVRTADERPSAAARSAIQLLPQAVSRVLGRRGRAGVHPGDLHPDLRRRRSFDGAAEAAARAVTTAQRLVEDYAALQQRGAEGARRHRRPDHGAGAPRDRRGRQPVRPDAAAGDQRARSLRVAAAVAAHAGRRLSRDPARSAADLRRRRSRSATLPYQLAAAPVRAERTRRDRHGADDEPRSSRSSSRSTSSIAACCPASCCSACSARRSATGWPSGSPIR